MTYANRFTAICPVYETHFPLGQVGSGESVKGGAIAPQRLLCLCIADNEGRIVFCPCKRTEDEYRTSGKAYE